MYKTFEGDAERVMLNLGTQIADEYDQALILHARKNYRDSVRRRGTAAAQENSEAAQEEQAKLFEQELSDKRGSRSKESRKQYNGRLAGFFWELRDGQLQPAKVSLKDADATLARMEKKIYVLPRFDKYGAAQPEYFLTVKKSLGSYKLILTDREDMAQLRQEVEPSGWDIFCDIIARIFGGRDKVCRRWDEEFSRLFESDARMLTPPENRQDIRRQLRSAANHPEEGAARAEALDLVQMSPEEDSFREMDENSRSQLVKGEKEWSAWADLRENIFVSVLDSTLAMDGTREFSTVTKVTEREDGTLQIKQTVLPEKDRVRMPQEKTQTLSNAVDFLAGPLDDPVRGQAAMVKKLRIEDDSKVALHMSQSQQELIEREDLLSAKTRMMFDLYQSTRDMARAGRGPKNRKGSNTSLLQSISLGDKATKEDKQAFSSMGRCYQILNEATRMKVRLADGQIRIEDLPKAALTLQKGKLVESLLEKMNGTSFLAMNQEQRRHLRNMYGLCRRIDENPEARQAAEECLGGTDYVENVKIMNRLLSTNSMARAVQKKAENKPEVKEQKPEKNLENKPKMKEQPVKK